MFFPKQFTVGVLNATLDLAALVLVGVVGFLGSEVVLSPVVSHCLRLSPVVSLHVGGGCWLVWSASWALKVVLSPVVSGCLPSCGGWVLVGVVGFLGSEVVLSPVVSGCLPSCGGGCWLVWPPSWALKVVLSPVVSGCLPSCGGWVLVGVAASRTKTFRNQNHRFQSKFAYCKLFGVYAGVISCFSKVPSLVTANLTHRKRPEVPKYKRGQPFKKGGKS